METKKITIEFNGEDITHLLELTQKYLTSKEACQESQKEAKLDNDGVFCAALNLYNNLNGSMKFSELSKIWQKKGFVKLDEVRL